MCLKVLIYTQEVNINDTAKSIQNRKNKKKKEGMLLGKISKNK